jgi:hypothetical protein
MAENIKIGRLALRDEGDAIKAYYAQTGTMEGAILLFSINPSIAHFPGVRDAILTLGRHIVTEIIFDIIGERPIWPTDPELAPEHERTGKA